MNPYHAMGCLPAFACGRIDCDVSGRSADGSARWLGFFVNWIRKAPVPSSVDRKKAVAPPAWFALIRGKVVRYKTEAGETHLTDSAGRPVGSLFSFSYLKEGPILPARPVMFVFNGGPGSSSLWLHVGAVGPERIVLDQEINPSNTPPFGLANNPYSPLDVADLVFIDPIGTGFSQAIGSGENQDFYGVDEDANSIAQFIELWLSRHHRWTAPKYLMGESYGSIRATVLTRALLGGPLYTGVMRGITLHGVILLGTIIGPSRAATQSPKGMGLRCQPP